MTAKRQQPVETDPRQTAFAGAATCGVIALVLLGCGDGESKAQISAAHGCLGVTHTAARQRFLTVFGRGLESREDVCRTLGPPEAIRRRRGEVVWSYGGSSLTVIFDRTGRGRLRSR